MANIFGVGCKVKEGDPALSSQICIYGESHLPLY